MLNCLETQTIELLLLAVGALGFGFILLIQGGNKTIDSAVYLANRLGISPMLIGFTIVAFGTSLPELIVSVNANLNGAPGLVLGNVVGSNIANILFVLGLTAAVVGIPLAGMSYMRDLYVTVIASAGLLLIMSMETISRPLGAVMILALGSYVFWQYRQASTGRTVAADIEAPDIPGNKTAVLKLLAGLAMISIGADFLVRGAQTSAEIIGVPDSVVGLSIVAFGTSLPELSTCIIAAMRRQGDIIIGNILGSNVFNILMIIGVTSLVSPMHLSAGVGSAAVFNICIMIAVTALLGFFLFVFRRLPRWSGVLFTCLYILFMAHTYIVYLA